MMVLSQRISSELGSCFSGVRFTARGDNGREEGSVANCTDQRGESQNTDPDCDLLTATPTSNYPPLSLAQDIHSWIRKQLMDED